MSHGPVEKITLTYPNTRSYAQVVRSQAPHERTGRTHHCTNDSDGVGNEVLEKSEYDGKHLLYSRKRTSAGVGQTGIRIKTKELTSHHEVSTSKVSETGGTNAAPVWSI